MLISSFAAYSMVRFRYRFRGLIGRLILFAYLTPASLLFIPLSIVMAQLKLGNSLVGLILVYLTFSLPLSTWLLQGYFRGVPREIEEQAMIDGHSRLGALIHIVLPLSAPGIAAVSIFTFTGAWNELLLALVLITSESQRTAPLALNYLITSDVLPWGPLMAGAVISVGAADDPLFRRAAFHGAGHDRRLGEGMIFKRQEQRDEHQDRSRAIPRSDRGEAALRRADRRHRACR